MKLFDWQVPYADELERKITARDSSILVVPPGGGKTYMAMEVLRRRGTRALVFCPKSVIPAWERVSASAGIASRVRVLNYEQLTSPNSKLGKSGLVGKWQNKSTWQWAWGADDGADLIFDEGHRVCGHKTKAAALALGAAAQRIKHIYLTATPPDSPLKMKPLGVSLGLFHRTPVLGLGPEQRRPQGQVPQWVRVPQPHPGGAGNSGVLPRTHRTADVRTRQPRHLYDTRRTDPVLPRGATPTSSRLRYRMPTHSIPSTPKTSTIWRVRSRMQSCGSSRTCASTSSSSSRRSPSLRRGSRISGSRATRSQPS